MLEKELSKLIFNAFKLIKGPLTLKQDEILTLKP